MNKPSDVLQACADVFTGAPEMHTKEVFARNSTGYPVDADSPFAVCWCARGLIRAACMPIGIFPGIVEKFLAQAIGSSYIGDWNNEPSRTPAQVAKAFQKAADLARERGQ